MPVQVWPRVPLFFHKALTYDLVLKSMVRKSLNISWGFFVPVIRALAKDKIPRRFKIGRASSSLASGTIILL
ncbi:hypothetical protein AB4140_00080 [Shewanella sp. 10N.286.51.B2]|uniref:hypothetical protein n=1 Tax=Shewanella sp. 10N.286.51.B2 TaxID=3229707 RepID=UPI0035545B38